MKKKKIELWKSSVSWSNLACWQVSEAIQIGAKAIKENKMSVEEVQHSLQEIDESIDTQKQIENALGNSYSWVKLN